MRGLYFLFIGFLLGFFWVLVLPSNANAQLKLCNETSYVLDAAFSQKKVKIWQTYGWFRLYPGFCQVVVEKRLRQKVYYIYARSAPEHRGRIKIFGGTTMFCVGTRGKKFLIKERILCREKDHSKVGFARIEIENKNGNWTEDFQETKPFFSANHAMVAGAQRLLRENGLEIGDVDGFWGKLTQRTIQTFQRSINQRPTGAISQKLFQQLLEGSKKMLGVHSGFRLCNETKYLVWASIGYRAVNAIANREGNFGAPKFESKGWIRVEPKSCAMLLREKLGQPRYYIYAEAVDEKGAVVYKNSGEPLVWLGDFPMCLRRLQFKITKRTQCIERGFQSAGFRRVETRGRDGWTEYLYEGEKKL